MEEFLRWWVLGVGVRLGWRGCYDFMGRGIVGVFIGELEEILYKIMYMVEK